MNQAKTVGRIVGGLSLLQVVIGIMVNFVLTAPLSEPAGFLATAADHAQQIGAAALLGLANGLIGVAIAVWVGSLVRRHAPTLGLLLVAVAVVTCAAGAVEQANVMSLVSLSRAYLTADAGSREAFRGLQVVVESARDWSHHVGLILAGASLATYYSTMFRLRLMPRLLAGYGLAATALQVIAIAMPFFGRPVDFLLLMPLALGEIVAAGWLIARGFSELRPRPDQLSA